MRNYASAFMIVLVSLLPLLVDARQATLSNPIFTDNIAEFIKALLQGTVTLALPFVAVYIIYSGFLFVTAQGNQEKLSRAKENFLWVILGSTLVLGAWMFSVMLGNTVDKITGQNNTQKAQDLFAK